MEESSQERAYWVHGYLNALVDVLRLFSRSTVSGKAYDDGDPSSKRYAA